MDRFRYVLASQSRNGGKNLLRNVIFPIFYWNDKLRSQIFDASNPISTKQPTLPNSNHDESMLGN